MALPIFALIFSPMTATGPGMPVAVRRAAGHAAGAGGPRACGMRRPPWAHEPSSCRKFNDINCLQFAIRARAISAFLDLVPAASRPDAWARLSQARARCPGVPDAEDDDASGWVRARPAWPAWRIMPEPVGWGRLNDPGAVTDSAGAGPRYRWKVCAWSMPRLMPWVPRGQHEHSHADGRREDFCHHHAWGIRGDRQKLAVAREFAPSLSGRRIQEKTA